VALVVALVVDHYYIPVHVSLHTLGYHNFRPKRQQFSLVLILVG
jgi:hypothetical protein